MSKILVAYFSLFSSTKTVAKSICDILNCDELEIVPDKKYSFDYNSASKEIRSEIERGFCPKLLRGNEDIGSYTMIFIGTPNWFKHIAPPVLSFIRNHNFSGKIIIPFCTHGGGGLGKIEDQIKIECPSATMLKGLAINGRIEKNTIKSWLNEIRIQN